jgi:aryl-alcohol dehydrogenase-like predicted oxidoreductase
MRFRPFGSTGISVSEVGFGCARIGGLFQHSSRAEIIQLLRRAHGEGITFFDTADMYTQGESERLLGEAFKGERARVILTTKVGYLLPTQKQLISRIKPLVKPLVSRLGLRSQHLHGSFKGTVSAQDFSPAYVRQALDASLRRLQTDYIDLYQLHDPPTHLFENSALVEELERLKQQGKIRCWGVAGQDGHESLAWLRYPVLGAMQVGVSALQQEALETVLPTAADAGLGVIGRQVYASGLLTRPVASLRPEDIDVDPSAARWKLQQLEVFAATALHFGRTQAELALQFNLARPEIAVTLLGMSRMDHLEANLRALYAPALTAEENRLLTSSFARVHA